MALSKIKPVLGGRLAGWVKLLELASLIKDLILFNEYFHGDTGKGLGAAHQTGWTGLVAELILTVSRAQKGVLKDNF